MNYRSKLLDAPYFDVCEQLPQDIMQAFHLRLLLPHCFEESALSLNILNTENKNFPLGYSQKKDQPVIIKENDLDAAGTNLGQSASQMHLMAQILPFILSKYIANDSQHLKCYLSLLEIMVICFSHKVSYTSILYLKGAIKDYLTLLKTLYNARITPKLHYLVHLPAILLKHGPLIRCWCMRFEGKHSYFKNLAKVIRNFKNLPPFSCNPPSVIGMF